MTATPRIAALIVAAGVGARVGGERPKQYQQVAGRPMISHSIAAFLAHPGITAIQVVIHADHDEFYKDAVADLTLLAPIHGGAERSDSVRAGLAALAGQKPDYVLIHDAARPFLSASVIDRIIDALTPEVGVVPTLPVHDTVRRFTDGKWEEVSRAGLQRIQTPQAFPFAALTQLYANGATATDDAALWLAAGRRLVYIAGDEALHKMTTAEDLARKPFPSTRSVVGMGFDVHELIPSGAKGVMRVGGIDIISEHKTHGHSDADVALHAIVDALLGTIADGDIGAHYSPNDPCWAGADSAIFLKDTVAKVHARGGEISHVDLTIICEAPKIGPHRDAMRARIAELLGVAIHRVSVKATTTERLGFSGRGEGIAAQAIATITLPEGV